MAQSSLLISPASAAAASSLAICTTITAAVPTALTDVQATKLPTVVNSNMSTTAAATDANVPATATLTLTVAALAATSTTTCAAISATAAALPPLTQ